MYQFKDLANKCMNWDLNIVNKVDIVHIKYQSMSSILLQKNEILNQKVILKTRLLLISVILCISIILFYLYRSAKHKYHLEIKSNELNRRTLEIEFLAQTAQTEANDKKLKEEIIEKQKNELLFYFEKTQEMENILKECCPRKYHLSRCFQNMESF